MKCGHRVRTGGLAALMLVGAVGCGAPGNGGNQPSSGATGTANVATSKSAVGIPTPGHMAAAFTLPTLNGGQQVSLKQLLGKKPILLNVWASWCHPCQQETPDLVKLAKTYGKQVQFVGVDLTSLDTVAQAKAFVINYHVPYTVLSDAEGALYKAYGIASIPTTYVLSSKGEVVAMHIGAMTKQEMKSLVQQAITAG